MRIFQNCFLENICLQALGSLCRFIQSRQCLAGCDDFLIGSRDRFCSHRPLLEVIFISPALCHTTHTHTQRKHTHIHTNSYKAIEKYGSNPIITTAPVRCMIYDKDLWAKGKSVLLRLYACVTTTCAF